MSKRVLMIVHQATSTTGRVGRLLRERGYEEQYCCPCAGAELPSSSRDYAGVVVFGGPMSANDENEFPGIRAELDWIERTLDDGTPFLGLCLGAQLLARALGAPVWEHPDGVVEIGYHDVHATRQGRALLPPEHRFFQWHRDSFDLPAGAERLAYSERFENQAFRYGSSHVALQFHPEISRDIMLRWQTGGARRLTAPGAQGPEAQRRDNLAYDPGVARWLEGFLAAWLGE
ncbi:MAG: glutamine amidotransferase [Pseudomonadota bacterium]